jgi:hypothetical protein
MADAGSVHNFEEESDSNNGNNDTRPTSPERDDVENIANEVVNQITPLLMERPSNIGRIDHIPEFSGTTEGEYKNFNEYVAVFEQYADLAGWTSENRRKTLGLRLKGTARKVFMGLSAEQTSTYSDLVRNLQRLFQPERESEKALMELSDCQQGKYETVVQYGYGVKNLVKQMKVPGEDTKDKWALQFFMKGLRANIKNHMMDEFTSFDAALKRAKMLEEKLKPLKDENADKKGAWEEIIERLHIRDNEKDETKTNENISQAINRLSKNLESGEIASRVSKEVNLVLGGKLGRQGTGNNEGGNINANPFQPQNQQFQGQNQQFQPQNQQFQAQNQQFQGQNQQFQPQNQQFQGQNQQVQQFQNQNQQPQMQNKQIAPQNQGQYRPQNQFQNRPQFQMMQPQFQNQYQPQNIPQIVQQQYNPYEPMQNNARQWIVQNPPQVRICYVCQKAGHIARDCIQNNRGYNPSFNRPSYQGQYYGGNGQQFVQPQQRPTNYRPAMQQMPMRSRQPGTYENRQNAGQQNYRTINNQASYGGYNSRPPMARQEGTYRQAANNYNRNNRNMNIVEIVEEQEDEQTIRQQKIDSIVQEYKEMQKDGEGIVNMVSVAKYVNGCEVHTNPAPHNAGYSTDLGRGDYADPVETVRYARRSEDSIDNQGQTQGSSEGGRYHAQPSSHNAVTGCELANVQFEGCQTELSLNAPGSDKLTGLRMFHVKKGNGETDQEVDPRDAGSEKLAGPEWTPLSKMSPWIQPETDPVSDDEVSTREFSACKLQTSNWEASETGEIFGIPQKVAPRGILAIFEEIGNPKLVWDWLEDTMEKPAGLAEDETHKGFCPLYTRTDSFQRTQEISEVIRQDPENKKVFSEFSGLSQKVEVNLMTSSRGAGCKAGIVEEFSLAVNHIRQYQELLANLEGYRMSCMAKELGRELGREENVDSLEIQWWDYDDKRMFNTQENRRSFLMMQAVASAEPFEITQEGLIINRHILTAICETVDILNKCQSSADVKNWVQQGQATAMTRLDKGCKYCKVANAENDSEGEDGTTSSEERKNKIKEGQHTEVGCHECGNARLSYFGWNEEDKKLWTSNYFGDNPKKIYYNKLFWILEDNGISLSEITKENINLTGGGQTGNEFTFWAAKHPEVLTTEDEGNMDVSQYSDEVREHLEYEHRSRKVWEERNDGFNSSEGEEEMEGDINDIRNESEDNNDDDDGDEYFGNKGKHYKQ